MTLREYAEFYRGRAEECRRLRDAIAADEPMSKPERDAYVAELDKDIGLWELLAGELDEHLEDSEDDNVVPLFEGVG